MRHAKTQEWAKQQSERRKQEKIERIKLYNANPKRCFFCKKAIDYNRRTYKFCSKSCSASVGNLGKRRNGSPSSNCEVCGVKAKQSRSRYCSKECLNKAIADRKQKRYEDYIFKWLNEEVSGYWGNGEQIHSYIKRYLYEKFNCKCEKCGWGEINPFTKKVPLTVHHKNGVWKDTTPLNVELLCPNCHSLTPTYGNRNKGKGRDKGRKKQSVSII